MTKNLFSILIIVLSFLSCKTDSKTEAEKLDQQKNENINLLANRYLELGRFSGVVLVAKDDAVIYSNSFGYADYENEISFSDDTAFKIGDVSDLIISQMIQQLVNDGKLTLSEKVSKYVSELESDFTIDEVLLQNSKNENFDYNNLILLIEEVSEKSFKENLDVFTKKLGLDNTYIERTNSNQAVGYLYHNYRGNGLELQKAAMLNPEDSSIKNMIISSATDILKIINSDSSEKIEIDGYLKNDGFSYSVYKNPESNISTIVLSNRRHPVAKEISEGINAIINDDTYQIPLARKPYKNNKSLLPNYAGIYKLNENINLGVLHENDSLFVMMGPNKIHLIPQSDNQFYMEQMDASMRFVKDENDVINEVILLDGFLDGKTITRIK